VGASFACGISVHPRNSRWWHKALQRLLNLFGSRADTVKSRMRALGAQFSGSCPKIAMMAAGTLLILMKRERYAAMRTTQYIAAQPALHEIGEPAAVKKY
jgi:hypothetical protein